MESNHVKDDALFEALEKKQKKRKRRIVRTVLIIIVALAVLLTAGVVILQRQVRKNFAANDEDVSSYTATVGSISTSVSGSGSLSNVDLEKISVPAGVEIEEVIATANSKIKQGEVIATIDMASVMSAMSAAQEELDSLDSQLVSAANSYISSYISSGVQGRVKQLYAEYGTDIAQCMYDKGALAVLSLDGYMALDLDSSALASGDSVKVLRADGSELVGLVEKNINGKATILVSDAEADVDEEVSVLDNNGAELGKAKLYIHSPLKITGISGTVSGVYVADDQMVYAGSTLFYLSDTQYSASYEVTLRQRNEAEKIMQQLVKLYQEGALRAPYSGTVSSVDYDESSVTEDAETLVATLSKDERMSVTINVDESHIMSLELGQTAQITIASVGDEVFRGELTEINRTASSSSGVTRYTAVVTLDKTDKMLSGMTASVVIRISGVDNAVIIPVDALHQTSSTAFVYTEYDEEMGQFGGMVQVVAGISNSSYVEIISGLEEGDTVWYTESISGFGSFGGFPGGMQMGGGQMPGGGMPGGMGGGMGQMGERPSGGFPGGGDFSGGFPGGGQMPSGGFPGGGSFPG